MTQTFDVVSFIMAYEQGDTDEATTIEGFQHLIDSGIVWQLQGSYGRMAATLIEAGLCAPPTGARDQECTCGHSIARHEHDGGTLNPECFDCECSYPNLAEAAPRRGIKRFS